MKVSSRSIVHCYCNSINLALVKVIYSGVCHTDLHAMLGDWPLDNKLPLIGGHEGAGYVVALGEHSDTELKIGDKVGVSASSFFSY